MHLNSCYVIKWHLKIQTVAQWHLVTLKDTFEKLNSDVFFYV